MTTKIFGSALLRVLLISWVLLALGCASSNGYMPMMSGERYVVTEGGKPYFSVKGIEGGWKIITPHIEKGTLSITGERGRDYTGEKWNIMLDPSRATHFHFFNLDMLVNNSYQDRGRLYVEALSNKQYGSRAGYEEVFAEPVQMWGLNCLHRGGYRGQVGRYISIHRRIVCPVVYEGTVWAMEVRHHWSMSLTGSSDPDVKVADFQTLLSESYNRVEPLLESVEFLIDLSQDPAELQEPIPETPEGMSFTEFYRDYWPREYQYFGRDGSYRYRYSRYSGVTFEDQMVRLKSSGATLNMIRQWRDYWKERRRISREKGQEDITLVERDLHNFFEKAVERWGEF